MNDPSGPFKESTPACVPDMSFSLTSRQTLVAVPGCSARSVAVSRCPKKESLSFPFLH